MMNASTTGDEVWVAAGTYKPAAYPNGCTGCSTNRDFAFHLNNGVKVYGGFAGTETLLNQRNITSNLTVLSGDFNGDDLITGNGSSLSISNNFENAYHVVLSVADANTTVLDGFTVKGGTASTIGSVSVETVTVNQSFGSGMCNINSSPTVSNCIFSGNRAIQFGGGMYNSSTSSPIVSNCTFNQNLSNTGGGMYNTGSSPTVNTCTFSNNRADQGGGGMLNDNSSSPIVSNCTFNANAAISNHGGGMYNLNSSSPTVNNCTFSINLANQGGGMSDSSTSTSVTNSTFFSNSATIVGGGMSIVSSPSLTVINCTFINNSASQGAGIFTQTSSHTITNCTFNANSASSGGGGMFNLLTPAPTVNNCIFYGNVTSISGTAATVSYSLVQGGYAGTGNTNVNPLFVDILSPAGPDAIHRTADDGLQLQPGSPAINDGNNSLIPSGITTDIIGAVRVQNSTVDMGAYEFGVFCPTLSTAPAEVQIINSLCSTGCAPSGGSITAPAGTPCPIGSTINYTTNNGTNWSSTVPTYNQNGPAQTIKTRCVCNEENTTVSPTSVGVTTSPGTCTPPTAGITNNTGTAILTCITTSISVTATGGGSYAWSGGATPSTAANSFNTAGTYTVTVTGAGGCTATASISITANNTPPTAGIINLTGTSTLTCIVTSISVTATGGGSYAWSGGATPSTAANNFNTAGTYTVTVTGSGGCTATASITINANNTPPTAGITNNTGTSTLTCIVNLY